MEKPTLLLGTQNAGKIVELKALLGDRFTIQGLPSDTLEVVEDGKTYRENARKKAEAYAHRYRLPTLADDSGLEVDVLNGAPGLYSARYGGDLKWPARWNYLIDACRKVSAGPWPARFRCVLCYFDGQTAHYFEGVADGAVIAEPRGKGGFGYDPVVTINVLGKTFAEATAEEKNRVSHRAQALAQLKTWLQAHPLSP